MSSPVQKPQDCRLLADFLGVLAHPARIQMLCALQDGPRTVSKLAEYADVSMSNASQHLRVMRDKRVVRTRREGQHVFYEIADPGFLEGISLIRKAMLEMLRREAEQAASFAVATVVENREP